MKLNIWTANSGKADAKKPVLLFIHGGRTLPIRFVTINLTTSLGFQVPGPNSPFYNGQYLADAEDVVVVTIKYALFSLPSIHLLTFSVTDWVSWALPVLLVLRRMLLYVTTVSPLNGCATTSLALEATLRALLFPDKVQAVPRSTTGRMPTRTTQSFLASFPCLGLH